MSNQKSNTENKKSQSSSTPNQQPVKSTTVTDRTNPAGPTETNTTNPTDSVFEDVDLSDPAPKKDDEEADYEMIEKTDAPFSSYNSQPDHKWKYEDGKKKKNAYEEDIFFAEEKKREREERERWAGGEGGGGGT